MDKLVRIKLIPTDGEHGPQWVHIEFFGNGKNRDDVDCYWMTEHESEATSISASSARGLARDARILLSNEGYGNSKAVYLIRSGSKWIPTSLKSLAQS